MDIAGVEKAMVGMAIFDMWEAAVQKSKSTQQAQTDPLLAAAGQAFNSYVQSVQVSQGAMINGMTTYALNPNGSSANLINSNGMAPFLALNILA
jgi:hypothetical protein